MFFWSILASLHPVQHKKNPYRVSKYQEYEHELNMSGIQYPVDIKKIGEFKHQNNISITTWSATRPLQPRRHVHRLVSIYAVLP